MDATELKVTPDRYVTYRYAGASGDFNPIHIDEEFAKQVGLPGRILHGLWTMAQVARAAEQAGGGFRNLRSLSVQFRGMGQIEQEVTITGTPAEDGALELEAAQGDQRIIRNARAEMRLADADRA
jgi:acyl dehydratase